MSSSGLAPPPPLPVEELEMLRDFYQSMGGPKWHSKDNWISGANPCGNGTVNTTWYGVECATIETLPPWGNSSSHVTGLALPQNNLVGNLPPLHRLQHLLYLDVTNPDSSEVFNSRNSVGGTLNALCGLRNLSKALLAGNSLSGCIPDCIQSLTNATVLNLDYNAIQGTTPDSLCHLLGLEELHMRGNHLHGTVPGCLGEALTSIRILDLSNIHADSSSGDQLLSGTLPESLCNLVHLKILRFQATQGLNGTVPNCLGAKQPQLQEVSLAINQFHGSISEELCQASALQVLYFYENALTGTLPSCLGSLSQLTDFEANNNQFHGPIPEEICQASALEYLLVSHNTLTGTLPSCLGRLIHLSDLDLTWNVLNGPIPEELCLASALEYLLLWNNAITGTIPSCLGSLGQLTEFTLHVNHVRGPVPEELCHASTLKLLNLYLNTLTGTIPSCLGNLSLLTNLDVDNNLFYGPIPEELCRLNALEVLYMNGNALTGTIPSCLGSLTELTLLDLDSNQLHGSMPELLCQLTSLGSLLLYGNALTGTIPSCLGSFSQLWVLDLYTNNFHGPIPEELCQASLLEYLSLPNNALTGTIPSCLGSLSKLISLGLENNQLYGPIPEEFCQASTLQVLYLYENALTGTLPSCLGSLNQLTDLKLYTNHFHDSIPKELCQVKSLEYLELHDNSLMGSLPSCLATSFASLKAMLLYNNDFTGVIPSEWALPSLMSIMLSNNPKLCGSLPSSLFHQQSASGAMASSISPNVVLRAVVIEGTSIRGTLPAALCSAPQLVTLAFSGNELTGSLPSCITTLQALQTLRVSNNHLTGSLPLAINNMTLLTVLDLSTNEIQGRVPAALGDISSKMVTMQLQLNRLSCDLPGSVLDWKVSSANVSLNLLDGNLFGCSIGNFGDIVTLTIQGAAGLRNANEQAFDAYSCGNSNYVLPVITITILALPVVVWLAFLFCRGRLALHWRVPLQWRVNPSMLINELDHADRQLRALVLGVMAAAVIGGSVALVLSLNVAKSAFDCEYTAAPTLANKRHSDMNILSVGVGAAGCVGLVLGLIPWWQSHVVKYSSSTIDHGSIVMEDKFLYPLLEEGAEGWNFDAERVADATPQKPVASSFEPSFRAIKSAVLILVLVILTIGPNFGYVLVVLSSTLTQQQKVASEMAITLAKTAIGTLLVPRVARKAVDLLVFHGALTFVRFRLRITIAMALSATTMIGLPVSIVLMTDPRCLYYVFKPQLAVVTNVPILECIATDYSTGLCVEYANIVAESTYTPSFAYDGERCVSAVLAVYGPVYLGAVLLAATLPAGMETIFVPWLAPWCYRYAESSTVARACLAFLRAVTWNVWPVLANAGVLHSNFSTGAAKLDYLAQRVVERAFVQVMVTLLVALTFGIAVPAVGGSCAVAAFVQLLHHRHVLGQIVALGRLEQPAVVPNLMGCTDIPVSCAVMIVVTVVLLWMCAALGYLEPAVVGCMLSIGPILGLAASCGRAAWSQTSSVKTFRRQDRAQSSSSSNTSQSATTESLLLGDDFNTKEYNN